MPRFSVLVTCYNASEFIAECVESLKGQVFEDWECLIGNDASTDDTAAVAEAAIGGDTRFRLINRETNMGGGENLRDLMMQAAGDISVELGGDDFLADGEALMRINAEYREFPDCEVTSGSFVIVPRGGVVAHKPDKFWWKRWCFAKTLTWKTALGRRIFEELGEVVFEPDTGKVPRYGWDVSIFLPIMYLARKYRTIHDITYAYREHEANDAKSHRADQEATEHRVCEWLDARLMPHWNMPWLVKEASP